jgi:hypothetical protein
MREARQVFEDAMIDRECRRPVKREEFNGFALEPRRFHGSVMLATV